MIVGKKAYVCVCVCVCVKQLIIESQEMHPENQMNTDGGIKKVLHWQGHTPAHDKHESYHRGRALRNRESEIQYTDEVWRR